MLNARTLHVARQLLIGVYTGTRPGTILQTQMVAVAASAWFDLDADVLHRRGINASRSNRRQPLARIHARLLPPLMRWRRSDLERGITSVIQYQGSLVINLRNSWESIARAAGS